MNNFMLFALLEIGGDNIKVSDAGSTIGGLNDILKSLGIAVGVIIITVAVVKLIIGLAQERPDQVSQSSLMFGVGIVFASLEIFSPHTEQYVTSLYDPSFSVVAGTMSSHTTLSGVCASFSTFTISRESSCPHTLQ